MGGSAMCDCVRCRAIRPKGPPTAGPSEHLCGPCLRSPRCLTANNEHNRKYEDLPDAEVVP